MWSDAKFFSAKCFSHKCKVKTFLFLLAITVIVTWLKLGQLRIEHYQASIETICRQQAINDGQSVTRTISNHLATSLDVQGSLFDNSPTKKYNKSPRNATWNSEQKEDHAYPAKSTEIKYYKDNILSLHKTTQISNHYQNITLHLQNKTSNYQYELDKKMFSKYSPIFRQPFVKCADILKGNQQAVIHGIEIANDLRRIGLLDSDYYLKLTQNCDTFKTTRGYITSVLSKQEEEFPLAFSMVVYKHIEMIERVLRSFYRPQNFYCIHVDKSVNKNVWKGVKAIADCFPNVFLSSGRVKVRWAQFTVLEAELIYMQDLYSKGKWKYFINLTGQEMPLKTNLELVKILTAYQGANDIEATTRRVMWDRIKLKTNGPPPSGLRVTKGSVHIVANHHYVDFILHNDTAKLLLNWVRKTNVPDETYFTMLNHNPQLGIPGTYAGHPEVVRNNIKPFMARFKNWIVRVHNYPCAGHRVRLIIILSTGDLPLIHTRPELIANKFYLHEDRVAVGCLEERQFNHTRDGFLGVRHFNTSIYEGLGFVISQVGRKTRRKFKFIDNLV